MSASARGNGILGGKPAASGHREIYRESMYVETINRSSEQLSNFGAFKDGVYFGSRSHSDSQRSLRAGDS